MAPDTGTDEKVREMATVTMRMPDEAKNALVNRRKEFEFKYHNKHGVDVEANHSFYPALVRAALSERTLDDILDDLLDEGVEEIDYPEGNTVN